MKRYIIGLLLSLFLLCSCATGYVAQQQLNVSFALKAGINLVSNNDFENGSVESWGMSDGVAVSRAKAHTGDYSLCVYPTGGVEYFYNVLTQDFDMSSGALASVWVKLPSALDSSHVRFQVELQRSGGRNLTLDAYPKSTASWQQLFIEIPASIEQMQYIVIKGEVNSTHGPVYFDDFKLISLKSEEINYIKNGSFNSGNSSWANFVSSYGRDGRGALISLENTSRSLEQSTLFQSAISNPKYNAKLDGVFTVFASPFADAEGVVRLKVEHRPSGVVYSNDFYISPDSGWQLLTLNVPGIEGDVSETLFSICPVSGKGEISIDDVKFVSANFGISGEVGDSVSVAVATTVNSDGNVLRNSKLDDLNPDGTTTHWDVWPGNPAEGIRNSQVIQEEGRGNVLKINLEFGNGQAVYQYCVQDTVGKFDFNKDYTFSCDVFSLDGKGITIGVKRRGIDGKEYNEYQRVDENTSGWNTWSITPSPAPVEIVQYDVIVDIGAGMGSVYIDNFSLKEAETVNDDIVLSWS